MNFYKVCLTCNQEKPLFEFPTHSQMHDKHLNICKDCHRQRCKEYYLAHREERCRKHREWRAKNKEHCNEYQKSVRKRNRSYVNEYMRRKRAEDPIWYYSTRLFYPIRYVLAKRGECKSNRAEEITGLPPKELYLHLISTWKDKYGEDWDGDKCDIDHIVPRSTAKSKEDVDMLFRYENLRLLKPHDNRSK